MEAPIKLDGAFIFDRSSSKRKHQKIMKAELECIPCIIKQAYNTANRATNDPAIVRKILNLTADYVKELKLNQTPADSSNFAYKITSKVTGIADPYREEKKKFNDLCLLMVPELNNMIKTSEDPLYSAIKVAIFGNLIDLGIGLKFDIERDMKNMFKDPFAVDDYQEFKAMLDSGRKKILYLGDNAGEVVFDRLLVERVKDEHDVTFVVKRGPVINDATIEDARYVGMTDIVKVIDTGSDGIGVQWSSVSEEFVNSYKSADIIISKGQGNFETMSDKPVNSFFLLWAKCDCVARELGVKFRDIVFKKGPIIKGKS